MTDSAPPPPAAPDPGKPAAPPKAPPPAPSSGSDPIFCTPNPDLREEVIDVLHTCYDPEIPVDIYELGLVYGIDVTPEGAVTVRMTLTSPACPVAESLPPEVEQKVRTIPGVSSAKVELVWEPPWGKHLLSESARLTLGMDGY